MAERMYFDNAASTALLPEVIEGITSVLTENYGNPSSIHQEGRKSRIIIEKARKTIANHLNCSIGEVFFTSGASEANNTVLIGAVQDLGVDHIIYSKIEHPSVNACVEMLKLSNGITTSSLMVDANGNLDLNVLSEEIKFQQVNGKKILVSIMYVNNEIGNAQPMSEIAKICDDLQVYLHTDAVQAIGKFEINLTRDKYSFLTVSAHKFHGPKGIGFFYMNLDNMIKPLIYGGAQERNMRSGTENTAYIHGLSIAMDLACNQIVMRNEKLFEIRSYFIEKLNSNLTDIVVLGNSDRNKQQMGICNISFPAHPRNEMMMMNLDIAGISASGGSACSSGIEYVSHVLKAIGHDQSRTAIRFSFSHLNSLQEIDKLIDVLIKLQS